MLATISLTYAGHPRRIRVHVPAEAHHPAPLLVLFDGQNVFGDAGSFVGGWHANTAVDALPATIARPVVVGVDHGGPHRIRELWRDLDDLLDFLERGVLPAVRARWPIRPGPQHHAIGGSSMGGLAALTAHFRRPELWGAALVMSPSLWVGRGAAFRELAAREVPAASKIYLDVGGKERGEMPRLAERMARTLEHRGYGKESLLWRPDSKGTHQERHWRRRLPKALKFLFRRVA